jgi:signal transduction histidine kinase
MASASQGVLSPPGIRLVEVDPDLEAKLAIALRDLPMTAFALPETMHLPSDALHVWLVPHALADAFAGKALAAASDAQVLLQSAMVVSPAPLSDRERVRLYEQGFAFIFAEGDSGEALRSRVWAMLQTRSRVLTEQILNRRLRSRVDHNRGQLENQQNFLYMAVHDLRGPLSAMICYAELLMEGVLGNLQQTQLEPIRTIHRSCQFMIDMVTDLLDSAKIEAGKLTLKLEKTSFQREVETTVASLKGLADSKNIVIEVAYEGIPEMYLDVQKVSRILSNLLGNAIKFTRHGGRITLRTKKQNNTLVFSIQDTGPGILPQDLESIFDRFNTASGSMMTGKGHGLGLAISKSFVELHGGRIFVESTRHRGSIFIVHLPIEKRRQGALRQSRRKVVILDLAQDIPGLESMSEVQAAALAGVNPEPAAAGRGGGSGPGAQTQQDLQARLGSGDFDFQVVPATPDTITTAELPSSDLIIINEPVDLGAMGHDYYLLALGGMSPERRCAVLVDKALSADEKETRRLLGYALLEKPCTPKELFDTLQAIFGQDRRQRSA